MEMLSELTDVMDQSLRLQWWQGFRTNVIIMPKSVVFTLLGRLPESTDEHYVLPTYRGIPIVYGEDMEKLGKDLFPHGHDYSLERDEIWLVDCRFYNHSHPPHKDHGLLRLGL